MIVGKEVDDFFQEKGANPNCPRWSIPQGANWAFFCEQDDGLRLAKDGFSCIGHNRSGAFNPLCDGCPIKGVIFPEVTSDNYLRVLYEYEVK